MKNTDGVLQLIRCFIEDYEKQKIHTPNRSTERSRRSPLFLEGKVRMPQSENLLSGFTFAT